jgi:SAM-dependent methyltransferase
MTQASSDDTGQSSPFARYLEAKISVDDRALNKDVLAELRRALAAGSRDRLSVLEVGGGLGTMIARLVEWQVLSRADYELVELDASLLDAARIWLKSWAERRSLLVREGASSLEIRGPELDLAVRFVRRDVSQPPVRGPELPGFDLLIANAVLDVVDVPSTLPPLLAELRPDGLFWFSVNFDGETSLLPELAGDAELLRVYHRSMDERTRDGRPAGDSRTGRHLFQAIPAAGGAILAAGASDWVVHARDGRYPASELAFLHHILDTIGAELERHADVDRALLERWLTERRAQAEAGTLVYIAHQLDFLGKKQRV